MKKILLAALVLGFSYFAHAQEEQQKDKRSEEIIIRGDDGKKMNLTVQINGDSILVNGKPLNEFIDSQVTIRKRKIFIHDGDKMMAFDFDNDNFQKQWDEAEENQKHQWGKHKETIKPFLGVTTEKTDGGVTITEVVKSSAAEKAGLKEGDIITKINDKKVENPEMLSDIVTSFKPKEEVKVYYKRDGKEKNAKAILGERKEKEDYTYSFRMPNVRSFNIPPIPPTPGVEEFDNPEMLDMPDIPEFAMPHQKRLGLKIQDTEDNTVKVIAVEDSSAAAKAGLKEGDIITEIDGKKTTNTDEARDQLHPEEGKTSYHITVTRNGTEMNFEVKIPKKLKTADL